MNKEILKTEKQIEFVKKTFQTALCGNLELTKVSSPIAILGGTGINDDLTGVERTVNFPLKSLNDRRAVIVNSLAKWKRVRLQQLEIDEGEGIVTDMKAIRPDEDYSPIHSIYVDQWDWEKRISPSQRTISYLKLVVEEIYDALKVTEAKIAEEFEEFQPKLPKKITFIHSEELVKMYPDLTSDERENKICEEKGAVFLIGIGGKLSNGKVHDGRAPDYDDWSTPNAEGYKGLNGDILLWNPIFKNAFEISSMGIRVDKEALLHQLKERNQLERTELSFHKMVLNDEVPLCVGGGIGQSRVCMYFLNKQHVGEVQVGIWDEEIRENLLNKGISLL